MSNEIINNEFFIIDSNNIESIKQKLYGYILQDEKVILEKANINNINPNGTYIYVKVDDTEIKLLQDFNGSYGLYLYQKDDYFAISNSFLKLVEYLKKNHTITFNKKYGDAFLFSDLCSFAYGETLINEIEVFRFIKIKPRKQFFFFKKKEKDLEIPYLAFFDEKFIYFSKDLPVNKTDASIRKVGNRFSLCNIINADFNQKKDKSAWVIKLEFSDKNRINNRYLTKEMRFDKENAEKFYEKLNLYFKKLNVIMKKFLLTLRIIKSNMIVLN